MHKNLSYNWHDPLMSVLEACLSRGDRRLGQVLYKVWEKGGRYDSWNEYMDFKRWTDSFNECGLDMDFYAERERETSEVLPWDHIDVGVRKNFLKKEFTKALSGELTSNCMKACSGCGAAVFAGGICDDYI